MKAGLSLAICSMVEGRIPLSLDTISFPVIKHTFEQQSELLKSNLCNRLVNKMSCYFCSNAYCTFTNWINKNNYQQKQNLILVTNWHEVASAVVIVLNKCSPGTLKLMTSLSSPLSWAFFASMWDRNANSSCSKRVTPNAAARRSAEWPIVSAVENSATAGS